MALMAMALAGCARRGPVPPLAVEPATSATLLERLVDRRSAVTSLRARARLRSGLEGVWTRQAVLVRRPDALRIDVLTPFGLVLAVGARDHRLWAWDPGEGVRYEGAASAANLERLLGAPIAVDDVVDVLLGLPPARRPIGSPELDLTDRNEYELRLPISGGSQTIWFAGDTLLVTRVEESSADGRRLRARFEEHEDGVPHRVAVEAGGRSIELAYESVELNVPLDPGLFVPPRIGRMLPLEAVVRGVAD